MVQDNFARAERPKCSKLTFIKREIAAIGWDVNCNEWMVAEMKNRGSYPAVFAFLALLLVGITGCAARAFPEIPGEIKDITETEQTGHQEETGQAGHQKETERAEQDGGAEETLVVTDHRINSPTVREYADRELFLQEYGFDSQAPYFEYFTEDGALQLELYYDEDFGVGCGLRYYPGEDREPEGFLFNGSGNYRYYMDFLEGAGIGTDRYSTLTFDGSSGKEEAEDYSESAIYREDGRPAHYDSQGWVTYLTEKKEMQKLLEINWFYREDGTLRERAYRHNSMVFGTWYSSRQSYYDEQERLVCEHCYVTHGSVDYYYIYEEEGEIPVYCLIIDHNTGLLCAELLEYHSGEAEMYYGVAGPVLAGETENRYAAAVIEAAEKEGKDHDGYVTHTYAADYDGDSLLEAFVIYGREINDGFEYDITGDCWFVDSNLEVSVCIDRACAFDMRQQFICQDGVTYLLIRYSIGLPWQAEIYTVRDNVPVEISGSYADKYVDGQGQVIQIQNAYDGQCTVMNLGVKPGEDDWRHLWSGHSWKRYTFIFDHGELREIPARELTREEVERIAPLPDAFDEIAPDSVKQFILRENGELNINMAVEHEWEEGEKDIDFSYITYRLGEDGEWEYVEEQMGWYAIQFGSGGGWDYIEELYRNSSGGH